nr:hypothetical protein [Tanacetum cinerariifolium]
VRPYVLVITATTVTPTDGPAMVKEKIVKTSLFSAESALAGTDPALGGFTYLFGSDFLIVGIRTVISPDTYLQKMSLSAEVRMRAKYNIKEKRRLASIVEERNQLLKSKDEEIENLKAQLLLMESEAAEVIRLYAEASKLEAIERSLHGEVKTLKEHNTILEKEKNELDLKVVDLGASVKVREQEVADLDAVVTSVKSQNDNLVKQVHKLELKVVNDKFDKLYADFVEMALHLEERENIANCRSSLHDVFIPLAEPFSIMALEGTGGTSDIVPVTPDTTTDLSMVVASTN